MIVDIFLINTQDYFGLSKKVYFITKGTNKDQVGFWIYIIKYSVPIFNNFNAIIWGTFVSEGFSTQNNYQLHASNKNTV